jgi:homopolymeric O-antigen transport system permease protein
MSSSEASAVRPGPLLPAVRKGRPSVVITADSGWHSGGLRQVWQYRDLLWTLSLRDVKVRYKQTAMGVAWAVLQPLSTMLIFTVLFSLLLGGGRLPSAAGVPYALSTCTGLIVWNLFAVSLSQSSVSLITNRSLVTKVYFPRLIMPAVPVVGALVDFAVGLGLLAVLVVGYPYFDRGYAFHLSWGVLTVPVFVGLAASTALAFSIWFAALSAIYHDVRYLTPFLTQCLIFVTPVFYDAERITSRLPPWARVLYGLNPLVGAVEGLRWAVLGAGEPPGGLAALSILAVAALLGGGLWYFRRMERYIADLL